jgi:hypothetical protein
MQLRWTAAVLLAAAAAGSILSASPEASASSVTVKVSPSSGLANGQTVTVTGRGLVSSYHGSPQTWFVTECTNAVRGHLNPSTDTAHCDVTSAKALHVSHNGTVTARFLVTTGIIGDGYCGTAGHLTCVIGVGTSQGLGTVVRITFRSPGSAPTSTTNPTGH